VEARDLRKLTLDEYVALDRSSDQRWEYVNGQAYAMAGGRPEHALVCGNVFAALRRALDGKPCLPFHDAQKIATARTRAYHYPDASVVCPPFTRDARDEHALTSPVALVEVLSPTTRDYDQGDKFTHYRSIDTLTDYVLVDFDARMVEHRKKVSEDQWLSTYLRAGDLVLSSIETSLSVAELWRDLERLKPAER
jgi:Uma2 family endonuclease